LHAGHNNSSLPHKKTQVFRREWEQFEQSCSHFCFRTRGVGTSSLRSNWKLPVYFASNPEAGNPLEFPVPDGRNFQLPKELEASCWPSLEDRQKNSYICLHEKR